jgi:hypothetical protein
MSCVVPQLRGSPAAKHPAQRSSRGAVNDVLKPARNRCPGITLNLSKHAREDFPYWAMRGFAGDLRCGRPPLSGARTFSGTARDSPSPSVRRYPWRLGACGNRLRHTHGDGNGGRRPELVARRDCRIDEGRRASPSGSSTALCRALFSTRRVRSPRRAGWIASLDPAGPPPITRTVVRLPRRSRRIAWHSVCLRLLYLPSSLKA